jgi:hypothetical protein
MAGPAVGPEAIPVIVIIGLHGPPEIQNLTQGISTQVETPFQRYRAGGCPSGGGEAPKNVHENQDINKTKKGIIREDRGGNIIRPDTAKTMRWI